VLVGKKLVLVKSWCWLVKSWCWSKAGAGFEIML